MSGIKGFTKSLYYEMLLTAKYMRMFGTQLFEQENIGINIEEFSTLDVIYCNPHICQRDLAKLILKDRANTGRLLDSLEDKNFIKRDLVERNNRPVKQISLTTQGEKFLLETTKILKERFEEINQEIPEEEIIKTCQFLQKLRTLLAETIKTQI
jgi:DNA-binding MarR family transcriptional regulator